VRSLTEGLAWASDGRERYAMLSQVAISKARTRLAPKPLAELFSRACVPLATPDTPGAFYRGRRLLSMDGATIDVADTPANAEVFGRAGTGRGDGSAFPQLRMVALGECGTHAVVAAAMDSYDVGEVTLAKGLVGAALGPECWDWPTAGSPRSRCGRRLPPPVQTCCGGSRATRCYPCWSATPTGPTAPSWSPPPANASARTCCRCGSWSTPSRTTGDPAPKTPPTG
jgi:Insertion element 4 transposase N-terminal